MGKQTTIDISQLSAKDLEALVAQKRKEEAQEREERRKEYEENRDALVTAIGDGAVELEHKMLAFKSFAFEELTGFRGTMMEYGELRGKGGKENKGNFSIQNDTYKVEFCTQVRKQFDERAEMAEEKLRTFMKGYLKKRTDQDVIDFINLLLERGKSGEFDVNLVNRMYTMRDRFDDENWREALDLFQESYSPSGTAQYVRVYRKNDQGGWDNICLDIARAKVPTTLENNSAA